MAAFWISLGDDLFEPTIHTQGPWDARFQHGGPPGALLVRQLERCSPRPDAMLARISIDILGPIPLTTLRAHARVVRPGRSVELLEAVLEHDGRMVMRATGWRIRLPSERPIMVEQATNLPGFPLAEALPATDPSIRPEWTCGFLKATEWRFVRGGFGQPGAATVWTRLSYPLVEGEEATPAQRLIAAADSVNGVSSPLDIREWQFIPPELTVHSLRLPAGEWICLDAATWLQSEGTGLATANLYDERGLVGRSAQSLLISRRVTADQPQ